MKIGNGNSHPRGLITKNGSLLGRMTNNRSKYEPHQGLREVNKNRKRLGLAPLKPESTAAAAETGFVSGASNAEVQAEADNN